MTDTIDLLNAIGADASLRYAPNEELAGVLEQANASSALKAAINGDRAALSGELGHKPMYVPQSQAPGHEEEIPDEDGDEKRQEPPAQIGRD
jgi:hypothetical protein